MFCMNCGNQLPDDALFCDKCGTGTNCVGTANGQSMSQNYAKPLQKEPIKGIVLNIVSFLITISGILISLFSAYFTVHIKYIDDFFGSNRYTRAGISLFSVADFAEMVKKYFDSSTADSVAVIKYILWICIIDIIVATILLIVRFTKLRGNLYNAHSSYVPITPVFMTVICLIMINSNEYLETSMSASMYVLIALFIANLIIRKFGENFNCYENYKAKHLLQDYTAESKNRECVYCGWENNNDNLRCSNCGKPLTMPIEYVIKKGL